MNDLIDGTKTQEALISFQASRKLGSQEFRNGKVTTGWWRGFLKRHENEIVTKRGEKFALNRHDWTTFENIQQMYDVIYDELVDARVALALSEPIFTDMHANVVDESCRFGLAQYITISSPNYILFADESGFSTSQKKDGHVGGQKLVVERGTVPQTMASTTDQKFTMLPFTSATGEAVCCAVIFQSKSRAVPATWRTGVDYSITPILSASGEEIDVEMNVGKGKYYPGGPTCQYNGKTVDCLTFVSESGGITGDILVAILTYFDAMELFPRSPEGPTPCLIVDGHQSRLDPKFVDYINTHGHKWKVCLGVPYATTLWQVGDASEQNGMVKSEWYREKAKLLVWKNEHGLPRAIRAEDVMPLLNKVFFRAYGNVAANKKAVADRGWYPPNRKLLEHPTLTVEQRGNSSTNVVTLPSLNVETGLAGSVIDRIIHHRSKSDGAKKAAEKRKLTSENIVDNIKKSQRLTSGVLTSNGVHSLNDPRFLAPYRERRDAEAARIEEAKSKRKEKENKLASAVIALRKKYGHEKTHQFQTCDLKECGLYLQYKKQGKKDPAMPKDLATRRARCIEWIARPSPLASPCHSEDEMDTDARSEEQDAIQGLLEMAAM
jgi:hypothetical protein